MISISDVAPRDRLHSETRTADAIGWTVQWVHVRSRFFLSFWTHCCFCATVVTRLHPYWSPTSACNVQSTHACRPPLAPHLLCKLSTFKVSQRDLSVSFSGMRQSSSLSFRLVWTNRKARSQFALEMFPVCTLRMNDGFSVSPLIEPQRQSQTTWSFCGVFLFPCEYNSLYFQTWFCWNISLQNF